MDPAAATTERPCLRMKRFLVAYSAHGCAIWCRSSSERISLSTSLSDSSSSSIPLKSKSTYQRERVRRTMRLKKSNHSSALGGLVLVGRGVRGSERRLAAIVFSVSSTNSASITGPGSAVYPSVAAVTSSTDKTSSGVMASVSVAKNDLSAEPMSACPFAAGGCFGGPAIGGWFCGWLITHHYPSRFVPCWFILAA